MFMRRGPMMRPVVRPAGAPLLRGMLVGGTAYAAGRSVARRAQHEQDQNAAIEDLQAQSQAQSQTQWQAQSQTQWQGPAQAPPQPVPSVPQTPPAPSAPPVPSLADQLTQLAALVQQGLMTQEEFAAAKAKLLGGG
ncbi:SHOCT domain-containing protein [Streptomyces sp. NPDC059009]|uniref:SHOCT domain-containing protein n=1 Tax=Streptomyces sp. NPDC059009 TaxID=3346694 RepID=UPI00368B9342